MNAREFLADDLPMFFDEKGVLQSAFPFEICVGTCQKCHEPLVLICGLERCPSCPVINQWVADSTHQLNRAKARMHARMAIQIVPDHQIPEVA